MEGQWRIVNDTPCWTRSRRTIWFLFRFVDGEPEYLQTPTGKLRTWRSREAADNFLAKNKDYPQ
jgi:hypothetical protein